MFCMLSFIIECYYVLDQPFEVQFVELNSASEAPLSYVQLDLYLRLKCLLTPGETPSSKLLPMSFKNGLLDP